MSENDEGIPVNFDLERMKKSLNSGFITLPKGLSREELREFIKDPLKSRTKKTPN